MQIVGERNVSMERIKVIWTYTVDIISVPDIIAKNLDMYTDDFREWVSGTSFDSKIKEGTCFGIEQYVWYLNDRYLSDCLEKVHVECENYAPVTKQDVQELKQMRKVYF